MTVSVVIPAYEAQDSLPRAVASVLATGVLDVEVIVVDDGSHDRTRVVAEGLAEGDRRVRVLRHPDGGNHGAGASRNLGVSASRGQVVAFLDADDWYLVHRFESALAVLRDRPDVEAVYETARVEVEGGGAWVTEEDRAFGITEPLEGPALVSRLASGQPWPTTAFTCRRALLERAGGFPERFRVAEDCHLWLRVACLGRVVAGNLNDAVSVYRRHSGNTYLPGLERRSDFVAVLGDVWRWSRNADIDAARRAALLGGVRDYLLNAVMICREHGRDDLAWLVLDTARRSGGWRLLVQPRVARQVASLVVKRRP